MLKNVDILGNLGIIVGRSKQNCVLKADEVQAASRTLFSYPVSTWCHRRQMAICPIVMALAFRAPLFNRQPHDTAPDALYLLWTAPLICFCGWYAPFGNRFTFTDPTALLQRTCQFFWHHNISTRSRRDVGCLLHHRRTPTAIGSNTMHLSEVPRSIPKNRAAPLR